MHVFCSLLFSSLFSIEFEYGEKMDMNLAQFFWINESVQICGNESKRQRVVGW